MSEQIDLTNKHQRYQFTAYIGRSFSDMGLLGEYEAAINIIIKDLKATGSRVDSVAHPILYMMRHSLELGYKRNFEYLASYSNRQTSNNLLGSHDLQRLHAEFKVHFDAIEAALGLNEKILADFRQHYDQTTILIHQLGATEVSAFRYTKNVRGQVIFESSDTKDIGEIKQLYDDAITMLVYTFDLISPFTDYKDLIDKIPDFQRGLGVVRMTFPSFQLNAIADKLTEQYGSVDQLKWKDEENGQLLTIITVENTCYLLPVKE